MIKREKQHVIPGLFVFLLMGIFAVMSVLLVLYAAQSYTDSVDRSDVNNMKRILHSFISGTVQSSDTEGTLAVRSYICRDENGLSEVFVLRQSISEDPDSGEMTVRRLYCIGGKLREYVGTDTDDTFDPMLEKGEVLCDAADMVLCLDRDSGLLSADFADMEGRQYHIKTALRTRN